MDERKDSEINPTKYGTTVERKSERELVVTRTFNGPAHIVFDAWTKPELLKRWWAPKSFGVSFLSCETDVREGGSYRFVFMFGNQLRLRPISRSYEQFARKGSVCPLRHELSRILLCSFFGRS